MIWVTTGIHILGGVALVARPRVSQCVPSFEYNPLHSGSFLKLKSKFESKVFHRVKGKAKRRGRQLFLLGVLFFFAVSWHTCGMKTWRYMNSKDFFLFLRAVSHNNIYKLQFPFPDVQLLFFFTMLVFYIDCHMERSFNSGSTFYIPFCFIKKKFVKLARLNEHWWRADKRYLFQPL